MFLLVFCAFNIIWLASFYALFVCKKAFFRGDFLAIPTTPNAPKFKRS
ncbi:hypothetical protein HPHPP1_0089 [Helicobacter pylori Hp P-1]|nr:hypothetical protein HPHPP1_0089 [Helicobacter pylori Hp P-1]EJC22474.1 hypothetical protein HPHPP1B_0032 [Helicobacter pylori Hp P-1b]